MNPTEAIRGLFDRSEAKYYEIIGTGANLRSPEGTARTEEQLYPSFLSDYEILKPGAYSIKFWKNEQGKKSAQTYAFYKEATPQEVAAIGSTVGLSPEFNPNHPYQKLHMQMMELQKKSEIDEIKRQYESKSDGNPSIEAIAGLFANLNGILDKAIRLKTLSPPTISGPQQARPRPMPERQPMGLDRSESVAYDNEETESFTSNLEKIAGAVGEEKLSALIAKLAEKSDADPSAAQTLVEQATSFI